MGKKTERKKKEAEARLTEGSNDEVADRRMVHNLTENSDKNLRKLQLENNRFEGDDEYKRLLELFMTKARLKFVKSHDFANRLKSMSVTGEEFEDVVLVPYGITERGIIPWMKEGNNIIMYNWQYGDPDQTPVKWPEAQELRSTWCKYN